MSPETYVPAYLEAEYLRAHPELTDAARDLVRGEIAQRPESFATTEHAAALVSYMRLHAQLHAELRRLEDVPDDSEFERERALLFDRTAASLDQIIAADPLCIDAQLLRLQLQPIPLDDCLVDMMDLERRVRTHLAGQLPGFDAEAPGLFREGYGPSADAAAADASAGDLPANPELVGWLHIAEALAIGCLASARHRAAADWSRTVMRAEGYPNRAAGTLALALARLEDEEGLFAVAREAEDEAFEDSPWYLLARTLLLYKLGRLKSARRALRDFAGRCEGGAFFLLNPTYLTPYLPDRPEVPEPWRRSHQAVWEADGIIADTPDFAPWAATVDGVLLASEDFAARYGF